ncbi:MAG: hypothetical protein V1495_09730 [Pseudomonadota bacterium]
MKNQVLRTSIFLVLVVASGWFAGCSSGMQFMYSAEDTGAGLTDQPEAPFDPFNPTPNPTPPGYVPALHDENFTQGTGSSMVDIVWMIDNSGSMGNNQDAIENNADAFTDLLTSSGVSSYQILVVSSDPDIPMAGLPSGCSSRIITNANASSFGKCAVLGTNGSGYEEGMESVRRALDSNYPHGPWYSGAAAPLNSGFLRSGADLQVIYVSDEEDQPDPYSDNKTSSSSWYATGTGTANLNSSQLIDLNTLISQLSPDPGEPAVVLTDGSHSGTGHLADRGHLWDGNDCHSSEKGDYKCGPWNSKDSFSSNHISKPYYAFVPTVANHVTFLNGLKTAGEKVRTHAVVTFGVSGPDECHKRNQTEEIGKRYKLLAQDPIIGDGSIDIAGGEIDGVCGDWTTAMNKLGLQAAGLDSCFPLAHQPIPFSDSGISSVKVNGTSVGFKFYPYGNKVCLDTPPAAGATIVVSYTY